MFLKKPYIKVFQKTLNLTLPRKYKLPLLLCLPSNSILNPKSEKLLSVHIKYYLKLYKKPKLYSFLKNYFFNELLFNKKIAYFFKNNYSYLFTKHGSIFILYNLGVVFPFKFLYKDSITKNTISLFTVRKKMYSFLKINEHKMHIFRHKKKQMLTRVINKVKGRSNFRKKLYSSHKVLYNFFRHDITQSNSVNFMNFTKTTFLDEGVFTKSNLTNYKESIRYKNRYFPQKKRAPITRIKFKPGYQRIWRHYRLALGESIGFRYIYQNQLTRFLVKFYRKSSTHHFSFNENRVDRITIYSRLVPDHFTFDTFFNNSLIFINNKPLVSRELFLYKNDFLQLEITNWYYIFTKWVLNVVITRNRKFKRLVFKKSLASRYKLMKQWKQRSYYTPKWIHNIIFDFSDIKPFLEVDFFTLSCFIIYDYNKLTYYTPQDIKVIKLSLFRLYNWKYIT